MNQYDVRFWKNAKEPREGSHDKNLLVDAESEQKAEAKARKHFAFATAFPWACSVAPLVIGSPAAALSAAGVGELATDMGTLRSEPEPEPEPGLPEPTVDPKQKAAAAKRRLSKGK